jgi:hypothetical protein
MALIVTIDANSPDDAIAIADNIAEGLGDSEQIACSAAYGYEYDNTGQRVYYLHPWDQPSEN